MSVTLTHEQEAAVTKIVNWLDNFEFQRQQVMRMTGAAGTGKTTIMRTVAERTVRRVRFAAFAGKAAMVLNNKGCTGAETTHKMIYEPRGGSVAKYRQELAFLETITNAAERATQEAKLQAMRDAMSAPGFIRRLPQDFHHRTAFALDEVSMLDKFIGQDLEAYGFPILAVGDPFQLDPVMGASWFFPAGFKPDIELQHIHRQAADSPVLRLATAVRKGQKLSYGKLGDSSIVRELTLKQYMEYDQILCGTNKMRMQVNAAVRKAHGRKRWLEPGEKLICTQNNYEIGVMNGSQWVVVKCEAYRDDKKGFSYYKARVKSLDELDREINVLIHLNPLMEGHEAQDKHWTPMLTGRPEAISMVYSYCITGHKSQGSQWDSVAVIDNWTGNAYEKWLYTCITRAAKKVTVVRK